MQCIFWNFYKRIAVVFVGFLQMFVDQSGLFVIFVSSIIAFINFFPRRQDENFRIFVFAAGFVKKRRISIANVVHIGQNVRNSPIDKDNIAVFFRGFLKLFFSSFQQKFAEQKRIFEKQLFDSLFSRFQGDFARNFGITAISFFQQTVDNGGFSGSGTADDYNNIFLHFIKNKRQIYSIFLEWKNYFLC